MWRQEPSSNEADTRRNSDTFGAQTKMPERERLIAETGFGNKLSCGGRSSRRAARHGMDIARGNATCFGW